MQSLLFELFSAAPYWTDLPPQSVDASVGDVAKFECIASGTPEPSIYWFINGAPIASKFFVNILRSLTLSLWVAHYNYYRFVVIVAP